MHYGWYSTSAGGTQRNGFFIDEDNRILFWLDKVAPGYVIDEDKALAIIETKKKTGSHTPAGWPRRYLSLYVIWLILLFMGISISSTMAFAYFGNTVLNIYFSPLGLIGTIGIIFMSGLGIPVFWLDRAVARRHVLRILSGSPKINLERPQRRLLKITENGMSKTRFFCSVVMLSAVGILLLWGAISKFTMGALLADSILFLLLAIPIAVHCGFLIYAEIKGARASDIRVYSKGRRCPTKSA